MKRLLLALALVLAPSLALAQGQAIGPPNYAICNQTVSITGNANSLTQIIAAATSPLGPGSVTPRISVCGWLFTNTAASGTFQLTSGTGSNCATLPVNLTPALSVGSTAVTIYQSVPSIQTTPGQALCVLTSVNTINGLLWFSQF